MALGIGGYFSLPVEPSVRVVAAVLGGGGVLALMALLAVRLFGAVRAPVVAPLIWMVALVALGFGLAALRAHSRGGPVVDFRYYGPVEGRIVAMDRSASGAPRVTLDQVVLYRFAAADTPRRVRISLHADVNADMGLVPLGAGLAPGDWVVVTAHLSAPAGPAEPGGFDFRRHAWFLDLGAVGYSRTTMLRLSPAKGRSVASLRMGLSDRIQAPMPAQTAGVAAALITGDRAALDPRLVQSLRRSNLAHLLAISGLHMGLVTGFVFALVRLVLSSVPTLALRLPGKKIAALVALIAGAGYLLLSGGSVATERAFVMAAVVMGAVICNRRAFSMRAVALAAVVVLVLRPESLLSPGFQMSFAATAALVACFGALREVTSKWAFLRSWFAALLISSSVAGAATAPLAAAHFNMIAQFGLLANLASVPLMGGVVMPAGVLAVVLMPLGWETIPLWLMSKGLSWIIFVAEWTASQPLAVRNVRTPPDVVLPLLAMGAITLMLWQGRGRWIGLPVCLISLGLWGQGDRPAVLISDTGGLVGVLTAQGRALSRGKGDGFVAGIWLENDGDSAVQAEAAQRWRGDPVVSGQKVHVVRGKTAARTANCAPGEFLVSNVKVTRDLPCRVFDPTILRATGSIAIYETKEGVRVTTARQLAGRRLWNAWTWPAKDAP